MNILNAIALGAFSSVTNKNVGLYETLCYFVVAGILNVITIFMLNKFVKSSYYNGS